MQASRDRLAADGIDLTAYNTPEISADLADLRVALGLDAMNLYGRSCSSAFSAARLSPSRK